MLTPKDVLYLEDVLDQSFVLSARIENEIESITTKEVLTCFEMVNKSLESQCSYLLKILEKEIQ